MIFTIEKGGKIISATLIKGFHVLNDGKAIKVFGGDHMAKGGEIIDLERRFIGCLLTISHLGIELFLRESEA